MLKNDVCFPYPVLRQKPEDYKTAIFIDNHKIEAGRDSFHVRTDFSVNNHEIRELINKGVLSYALYIFCPSTMYRHLEYIQAITDYRIPAGDVHLKVEVTPCILVRKELEKFFVDDFQEDFQGMDFNLRTGDIVGLGNTHSFKALYEPDIVQHGSPIIDIEESEEQFMEVKWDNPHIVVKLPKKQFRDYRGCKGITEKYDLLNSVITVPVLVQAISMIEEQEDDNESIYSQNAWYNTLIQKLQEMAPTTTAYSNLLENPVTTAERILADNSARSLLKINENEIS